MVDLTDPTFWIPTIIAIIAVIPLYLDLWNRRKIDFILGWFPEKTTKPIRSQISITILHPNKTIERCNVSLDNERLPLGRFPDKLVYEIMILAMGGENFRIPDTSVRNDAVVRVKNGDKPIRTRKFKDIAEMQP